MVQGNNMRHFNFTDGGEMGERIRSLDWSRTPLGPVSGWPQSLKTAVSMMVTAKFPMMIHWGPELIHFYNDGYATILRNKHPGALGEPAYPWWSEIWDLLDPIFQQVWAGKTTYFKDQLVTPNRRGFVEEAYFTFSHSPIYDESGQVSGILATALETSGDVVNRRRLAMLGHLAAQKAGENGEGIELSLASNPEDIPFALIYLVDEAGTKATLAGRVGDALPPVAAPFSIDLRPGAEDASVWPLAEAMLDDPSLLLDLKGRLGELSGGVWPEPTRQAFLVRIDRPGQNPGELPYGVLVAGVSPRRPWDEEYASFLLLIAEQIGRSVADARAQAQERKRREILEHLNKSLDSFVHVVAHDLRSPANNLRMLLEMYGESEALYANEQVVSLAKGEVKKLQATLDGLMELLRHQGTSGPQAMILRLGDVFHAVECEYAGLIKELRAEIYADFGEGRTIVYPIAYMESILKNMLGNALKYHSPDRQAKVWVSTHRLPDHVLLTIQDNGVGIDLTRYRDQLFMPFKRFHSSQEGTGLGLHMINNIVQRNGGHIEVESQPGVGTTFSVYLREYPLSGN